MGRAKQSWQGDSNSHHPDCVKKFRFVPRRLPLWVKRLPIQLWKSVQFQTCGWAQRHTTRVDVFHNSCRMRALWCFLQTANKKPVQLFVFAFVMYLLSKHLYSVGIYKVDGGTLYSIGPARKCGTRVSRWALERLRTWREACNTEKLREQDEAIVRNQFYTDNDKHFLFCSGTERTAMFWKRVIRYANNGSFSMRGSPFNIPEWQTFYLPQTRIEEVPRSTVRFMFVEDPYVRLWNTWVDKFFLMSYWFKDIEFPKDDLAQAGEAKEKSICESGVTFSQFLSMVTANDHMEHPSTMNVHWQPQVHLCDICWVQPVLLGKMDTVEEDTQCILHMTNYSWMLSKNQNTSKETSVKMPSPLSQRLRFTRDMRALIVENFAIWHLVPEASRCISLDDLVKRLWTAFQYKGYISTYTNIPSTLLGKKNIGPEEILKECARAYFLWPGRNVRMRTRKRQEEFRKQMARAYKLVPTDTMENLQKLYRGDFISLGYQSQPVDIFDFE